MHEISRFPEKIILFTMALGQETLTVCAKISNFALMNSSLSSSACAGSAAGSADRQPTLYLLPVPLSDVDPAEVMPPVNIEIARSVRHFIVENIRSARRFLKRCDRSIDIDSLTFDVLDEHTRSADVAAMLAPMERGEDMAVVSEAGCPAVADPGSEAVAEAQRRGYRVCPLVGPSSILLALMASGFNGQTFAFAGYLPVEPQARASRLKEMQRRIDRERQTQIFIETPYRNNRMLKFLATHLRPDTLLCVACDISSSSESIVTMPAAGWRECKTDYDKRPSIFLIHRNDSEQARRRERRERGERSKGK